jgi:hypothetical protein
VSWWPTVVFGWPAILSALALSVLAIARSKPFLLAASAVIAAPFSFYLGGTPRIGWLALMIPLSLIGACVAVWYRRPGTAWLLLVPVVAVVGWVASTVLRQ